MKKISGYFISLLLPLTFTVVNGQDTIPVPRTIRLGADIYGPLYHIYNNKNMTVEGFLSIDIDTNRSVVVEGGYLNYEYSQYNYDYLNNGIFLRAGIDFNLLRPETALGKHYAGIGLRYGLSSFTSKVPYFSSTNYWGKVEGSLPPSKNMAHFVEVSPGIRTELFRYFQIGWSVRLRFLVYSNTDKNLKAIYIPGYGNATKVFSPGINYYIVLSIPYKR